MRIRAPVALLAVAVVWLGQAAPAVAVLGWSQTGSQTAVQAGQATAVTLRVSNDNLLSLLGVDDIGCIHVEVGSEFGIQSVVPAHSGWVGSHAGGRAVVQSTSGGDRLGVGESISFTVTAVAEVAGSFAWSTRVLRDHDCGGPYIAGTETFSVQVAPAPNPTQSARPTPTSTPSPTPLVPLPTASLPIPVPSLGPSATSTPVPRTQLPSTGAVASTTPEPSATDGAIAGPTDTVSQGRQVGAAGSPAASVEGLLQPPGSGPSAGGTAPTVTRLDFDGAELELGLGSLGLIGAASVWLVPVATFAVPGFLLLLLLGLQSVGALAWVPAVRRLRGEDRERG